VRSSFTRTYNLIKQGMELPAPVHKDLHINMEKLERLARDLMEVDDLIKGILSAEATDEDYDKEYEAAEEYQDKIGALRFEFTEFLSKGQVVQGAVSEVGSAGSIRRKFKLPKVELKKFGGELKEWLGFWSQFKRIHDDADVEVEDKFHFLLQSMVPGSRAQKVVESYPPTAANYPKAIEALKDRFGRDDLLIEVYVRELHKLTTLKKRPILQLYDDLESLLRSLESLDVTSDKFAAMLLPLVESCLPEDVLRTWQRTTSAQRGSGVKVTSEILLKSLLEFLRGEVEGEQKISMAQAGYGTNSQNKIKKRTQGEDIPTAAGLFHADKEKCNKSSCVFCSKGHEGKDCIIAQSMSLNDKKEKLSSKDVVLCAFARTMLQNFASRLSSV